MSIVRGDAVRLPLRDESVDLIVTSPPYFALRSYRDGDEHYGGQIGSEATPVDFLRALWAVLDECWRVLKPTGSCWVNLGDKYAGSGRHNNSGISGGPSQLQGRTQRATDFKTEREFTGGGGAGRRAEQRNAARRNAPDRYNQAADVLPKSVMGLPWRFALGAACPDPYRTVYDPGQHPQWINRRPHIWHKPNGLPESVTDRCRANFEDWFMLTKQGRYFSAVDEIREPSEIVFTATQNGTTHHARAMAEGEGHHRYDTRTNNPLGKLPGSVWTVPTEPLIIPDAVRSHYQLPDHFAAFPQELPRRIILGWSPSGICTDCDEGRRPVTEYGPEYAAKRGPGTDWNRDRRANGTGYDGNGDRRSTEGRPTADRRITGHACACPEPTAATRPAVILDPFAGTGTVAGVAQALGRTGIGVELSHDYCRLAQWRTQHSGHFAKTASRTDAERQGNLLDLAPFRGVDDVTVTEGVL